MCAVILLKWVWQDFDIELQFARGQMFNLFLLKVGLFSTFNIQFPIKFTQVTVISKWHICSAEYELKQL